MFDNSLVGNARKTLQNSETNIVPYDWSNSEFTRVCESMDNALGQAIVCCNISEKMEILYKNEELLKLTGYNNDEIEKKFNNEFVKLVHNIDKSGFKENVVDKLGKADKISFYFHIVKKDSNTPIPVYFKGSLHCCENGKQHLISVIYNLRNIVEREEAIKLVEKKCEIAINFCEIDFFDYNILTKEIINNSRDIGEYNMPEVVRGGIEEFMNRGVIHPDSFDTYRELYKRIDEGAKTSEAIIYANDFNGNIKVLELRLEVVPSLGQKPIFAVGLKRDITETVLLKKERKFAEALISKKWLVYEANISKDLILFVNEAWLDFIRVKANKKFSKLVANLNTITHKDDFAKYKSTLSIANLMKIYKKGVQLYTLEYRRKINDNSYNWFKITLNIVKDVISDDIILRCYVDNINDKKQTEMKSIGEKMLYETVMQSKNIVYEVNFSRDIMLSSTEDWEETFKIPRVSSYSKNIEDICNNVLMYEDCNAFKKAFLRDNVINAFKRGVRECSCEYRRPDKFGKYSWVFCNLHLYQDPETNDIKGFSYIEDINDRKIKEIELIYRSEHDPLTGVYNKIAIKEKIDTFLATKYNKNFISALIIIDIDNFKVLNDNFGHFFGDAVLTQIANKIKKLFREGDYIGRIGGDEFVVFMKNCLNDNVVKQKAQSVCDVVKSVFSKGGKLFEISASAGVAFFPENGQKYDALYTNSDMALYHAKNSGRNQYAIYHSSMIASPFASEPIDDSHSTNKSFNRNLSEYVFSILYETDDKELAIEAVLELVGNYFNLGRSYVYELNDDDTMVDITYAWNSESANIVDKTRALPCIYNGKSMLDYFNDDGYIFIRDTETTTLPIKDLLKSQNVKSALIFAVKIDGEIVGFVGYDDCSFASSASKEEIAELKSISGIIGLFVFELINNNKASQEVVAKSIIDSIINPVFVLNQSNANIIHANLSAQTIMNSEGLSELEMAKLRQACCRNADFADKNAELKSDILLLKSSNAKYKVAISEINWHINMVATLVTLSKFA